MNKAQRDSLSNQLAALADGDGNGDLWRASKGNAEADYQSLVNLLVKWKVQKNQREQMIFDHIGRDKFDKDKYNSAEAGKNAVNRAMLGSMSLLDIPYDDSGNLERMEEYASHLKFMDGVGWLAFTGVFWEDASNEVPLFEAWSEMVKDFRDQVKMLDQDNLPDKLMAFEGSLGNASRFENFRRLAEKSSQLSRSADLFDADPILLNTASCTLQLGDGHEFRSRPHAAEDMLTKVTTVAYEPLAKCPRWERCLELIAPDAATRRYLRQIAGTALTGHVPPHAFLLLGAGDNGKSVYQAVLEGVLGDYAAHLSAKAFTGSSGRAFSDGSISQLRGSRLVVTSETSTKNSLQSDTFKKLSSEEPLKARDLYGKYVPITPSWTWIIGSNHGLGTDDDSTGMWKRFRQVPFEVDVVRELQTREEEAIPLPVLVGELIRDEGPGILNWMIEGLRDFRRNGFVEPLPVKKATEETRETARIEESWFSEFLHEQFEATGDARDVVPFRDIDLLFIQWLDGRPNNSTPTSMGRTLTKFTGFKRTRIDGLSARPGLKLKNDG